MKKLLSDYIYRNNRHRSLRVLLGVVFILAVTGQMSARAANYVWLGNDSGTSWSTGTNWNNYTNSASQIIFNDGSSAPTGTDSVYINNGAVLTSQNNGTLSTVDLATPVLDSGSFGSSYLYVGSSTVVTLSGTWYKDGETFDSVSKYTGSGTGFLNIQGTGTLSTTNYAYIGDQTNNMGTVTVSGSGYWQTYRIFIGNSGTGVLNITDSGSVSTSSYVYVGASSHGYGEINVSGSGRWLITSNAGVLQLGSTGTGILNISDHGYVSAYTDYIGLAPGTGIVTVSGSGVLINTYLYVGYTGSGTLNITDSGSATSSITTSIGDQSGSHGTVNVSGSGLFSSSVSITIGNSGNGALIITENGRVTDSGATLGSAASAYGSVNVSDNGFWNNSGAITIGNSGTGVLTITNSGSVKDSSATLGSAIHSYGSGTVGGVGLWNNSGVLTIGSSGTGVLTITDSGSVLNSNAVLGSATSGYGSVTVNSDGFWSNSGSLTIGSSGTGVLSITQSGSVKNSNATLGAGKGSLGEVTVDNSGKWQNTGALVVGGSGVGLLTIQGSGEVTSASGTIGLGTTSSGTVIIGQAGSWIFSSTAGTLTVGASGKGVLGITDGGTLSTGAAIIGAAASGSGTVTLDGSGIWLNSGTLTVANSGTGILALSEGGNVITQTLIIGGSSSGKGAVTLTDGALLQTSGSILVGSFGAGSLTLSGNSTVQAAAITLAAQAGSSGSLALFGGTLVTSGLFKGAGTAMLDLNGGSIQAAADNADFFSGFGDLILSGSGLPATATALTFYSNGFTVTATNNFSFVSNGTSSNRALQKIGDGTLVLTGSSDLGEGGVFVNGGTLNIQGVLTSGSLAIGEQDGQSGSVLVSGSGFLNSGSSLVIGDSGSGSLTVSGSAQAASVILASGSGAGTLNLTGGVLITGGFTQGGGTAMVNLNGGTIQAAADNSDFFGALSGSNINIQSGGVTFDTNGHSNTITQAIVNDYTFTKSGSGTLTFTDNTIFNTGTFNLTGGTLATSGAVNLGNVETNQATVNVSGSAFWNGGGGLYVGNSGSGGLIIADSGSVSSASSFIGSVVGSQGSVLVSGSGFWNSGALAIGVSGTGILTITDSGSVQASSVTLAQGSGVGILNILGGTISGSSGVPVTISGGGGTATANFFTTGDYVFFNTLADNLAVNVNSSGTVTFDAVNSYTGNTTINGGVLQMGVVDAIAQSATLAVNSGATFDLNDFNQSVNNLEANGGLISFGTAVGTFSKLTVNGDLSGNGTLNMRSDIANNQADQLIVSGSASGSYTVNISNSGAAPASSQKILSQSLLEFNNSGVNVSSTGVTISGTAEAGMYQWNLVQGSTITGTSVANPDAYYLVRSDINNPAGQFLSAAGDAILGLQASQSAGWFAQQNSLLKRMGDLRLDNTSLDNSWLDNVWVRSYGEQLNIGGSYGGQGFSATAYGVQLGTDKAWQLDEHNLVYTGVFLGYGSDDLDFRNSRSEGSTDSVFFGTYASWLNDDGWYADATARFSSNDNSLDAYDTVGAKTRSDYDNWYLGGSLEAGRQFKFKDGWFVEPQVELSYAHITGNNYTTSGASVFTVDLNDSDVFLFRGGAIFGRTITFARSKSILQPYFKVMGTEQFSSGGEVTVSSDSWRPTLDGAHAEIGAGIVWQLNANNQLHLDYEAAFGDNYDKPWGVNAGYRYSF